MQCFSFFIIFHTVGDSERSHLPTRKLQAPNGWLDAVAVRPSRQCPGSGLGAHRAQLEKPARAPDPVDPAAVDPDDAGTARNAPAAGIQPVRGQAARVGRRQGQRGEHRVQGVADLRNGSRLGLAAHKAET